MMMMGVVLSCAVLGRQPPKVIDEIPMAYKDIGEVMAAQHDLVRTVARFHPRIVKMAGGGEPPED